MRITTRGQLAVSAMTDLALRQKIRPVALSTISTRQGLGVALVVVQTREHRIFKANLRWPVKSYSRIMSITSCTGHAFCTGIISALS